MYGAPVNIISCTIFAAMALTVHLAQAQVYPSKAIRVVIPWPAAGTSDTVARAIAPKLGEAIGQQLLMENRPGGSGIVGAEVVAKSPPDGYTIMIHSTTHIANAHIRRNLPYDTLKDFVAIAPLSAQIGVLVVHPSMPVSTTKELIGLAKSRPAQIVYGSAGFASFHHLAMALLNAAANTHMIHVAYKGGGPAGAAIGYGEVQVMIASIANVLSQIEAKRVRVLAVTSDRRVALFPKVPTIAESGVPGYEFTAWVGAFAPANTPKAVIDKLNADMQRVLRIQEVAEALRVQTLEPMFMTPEAFAKRLRVDYEKYGKIIRATGTTVD